MWYVRKSFEKPIVNYLAMLQLEAAVGSSCRCYPFQQEPHSGQCELDLERAIRNTVPAKQ